MTVLYHVLLWRSSRDEDLGNECEGQCEQEYVYCNISCSDTNCLIDCGRDFNACVLGIDLQLERIRTFNNC